MHKLVRLAPALTLVALLTTGCATGSFFVQQTSRANTVVTHTTLAPLVTPELIAIREVFAGIFYDYEPAESTEALESMSDVVIRGTIESMAGAVVFGQPDPSLTDITSLTLAIRVTDVASGELAPSPDGLFYLNVTAPLTDLPSAQAALPPGTEVVVYAVPHHSAGQTEVTTEGAELPAPQPQYLVAHPQGLAIEVPGSDETEVPVVMWPYSGAADRVDLSEALPGGTATGHPAE